MARSKTKTLDFSSALLQQGKSATLSESSAVTYLPVAEMPMILTLDEMGPNPDNPRTSRNPKYDDIKTSIRARGLDTVPKVTRDPEACGQGYIFSDGGNTRYEILCELWQETGEERFYRIPCLFKPWPGRLSCVIGHLAENEVRGDLSFIEKALGIKQARSIYEEQTGKTVTLRELSALLTAEGYPIHFSGISRMEDTVKYLYPYMPALLESGFGAPQIRLLLSLRSDAEKTWNMFASDHSVGRSFMEVFGEACRHFDDPEMYSLEMFRDELIGGLLKALPHKSLNYDRWLLELDPKEQNRRKHFGELSPLLLASGDSENLDSLAAIHKEEEGNLPSLTADQKGAMKSPSSMLTNARSDTHEELDGDSDGQPLPESVSTPCALRVEAQPDMYGAPPIMSGDIDEQVSEESSELVFSPVLSHQLIGQAPAIHANPNLEITAQSDVTFAEVGLEPVSAIWAIPVLQDDIEHLQVMAFRLAFELAEVTGCAAEIRADKSSLNASGYGLSDLQLSVERTARPSFFSVFLLSLTGESDASTDSCSLREVLIGSDNPAGWPLLDDIHSVKLMRLIRVMRRLRELQRGLSATEENA